MTYSGIAMGTILQEIRKISILGMSLKISNLTLQPYIPEANEVTNSSSTNRDVKW